MEVSFLKAAIRAMNSSRQFLSAMVLKLKLGEEKKSAVVVPRLLLGI